MSAINGTPREGTGKEIYRICSEWHVHVWSRCREMFTVSGSFEIADQVANSWLRAWGEK